MTAWDLYENITYLAGIGRKGTKFLLGSIEND